TVPLPMASPQGGSGIGRSLPQSGRKKAARRRTALRFPWIPALLVEEAAHLAAARRVLQLAERLRLDLTDAFAGHAELLADFLERMVGVHADAEAHAENALLARGERRQYARHRFLEVRLHRGVDRDHRVLVLDEIAEVAVFLVPD